MEQRRAVVAAANRFALACFSAIALVTTAASADDARLRAIDDAEILGTPDDEGLRITSVTMRVSGYDQKGNGYQSKAGPTLGPGSEALTVFQPQLEVLAKQGPNLTHRFWVPLDIVTSASANAIDRDRVGNDMVSSASRVNESGTMELASSLHTPLIDLTLRNGFHLEEEFRSFHGGFVATKGFAEDNTVLSAGILTTFDWFDRFDINGHRHGRARRTTETGTVGLTQILSSTTIAEASYGLTRQDGELQNAWNIVPLESEIVDTERLPSHRWRHAIVGRVAQALPWDGALKLYYRFYADDWSIVGHTGELQLSQRFAPWLVATFGYRHHFQTSTRFFSTFARVDQLFRTADSDLDRFDANSFIGKVTLDFPLRPPGPKAIHIDLGYEAYSRTNDLRADVMTCATGFSF